MNAKIIKGSPHNNSTIRKCYLLSMVFFAITMLPGCHYSGNEYYYHELDKIDHRPALPTPYHHRPIPTLQRPLPGQVTPRNKKYPQLARYFWILVV